MSMFFKLFTPRCLSLPANSLRSKTSILNTYYHTIHLFTSHSIQPASNAQTILVGLDGTRYGYFALQRAFQMSNAGDRIIGLHIPLDSYQFAYEHLVFQPGIPLSASQKKEYGTKREEFVTKVKNETTKMEEKYKKPDTIFEFFVGEDSIAIKQDLVDACEEFEVDMLVLGAKGPSSSMKEKLERTVVDILGSVPDYCVNHAQCSVSVIKPPNNYLQSK